MKIPTHNLTRSRLQILHCLEHTNGIGGETILVDGYHGAMLLKAEHPEDFKFLTEFNLQAEYIEAGHHHKYSAPVISLDEDGDLKQIRYRLNPPALYPIMYR